MEPFHELLLEVWREACRHTDIGQSTGIITGLLRAHMPVAQVLVRRVDQERHAIETVAVGLPEASGQAEAVTQLGTDSWAEFQQAWVQGGVAEAASPDALPEPWRQAAAWTEPNAVLVGPLRSGAQATGVLVMAAPRGQVFSPRHVDMMRALLDPFATALDNHHRFHEMERLRASAEADKESLLTRLGRKEIGDAIIGAEGGLRPVLERIERVAPSDVPVLFFGESGTGKELMARAIHTRSRRHDAPIIRVNCGAIPPDLLDSHLFGHERGAFTGAVEARKGWFERADGGTLFLDEIGELPLAAQVRLLRILQDGWLERVGGSTPVKTDVRIVAATHQDLAGMVATGRFREDLWYRLAVFPIVLPPLRQRLQDMPLLARHFAERAALRFGLPPVAPSAADIQTLCGYGWPGNVRELGTVIDRAAILGEGHRLEIEAALGITPPIGGRLGPQAEPSRSHRDHHFPSLDEAMRRHIEAALEQTRGKVEGPGGAARFLDINPHTLRARMRKLGIDPKRHRQP
jgi:transcriptional regulator with GAF, ATPase, and Fis domain